MTEQILLFSGVFPPVSWDELERRYLLAMTHLRGSSCGHTAIAFLIMKDGHPPAEPTRCPRPFADRHATVFRLHTAQGDGRCPKCAEPWPCATVRALQGKEVAA